MQVFFDPSDTLDINLEYNKIMQEGGNNSIRNSPIGVMDSGVGGITTLVQLCERLPCENFVYLADKSGAPYGDKSGGFVLARTLNSCRILTTYGVKAIVIACNTATNVAIQALRNLSGDATHPNAPSSPAICPILVGVEPAIKPALASTSGRVLVLVTPATARQQKFADLVSRCDEQRIIVSPQQNLALQIEQNLHDLSVLRPQIAAILHPYNDVEAVVLGCTHYVFLAQMIAEQLEGRAKIFDGNQGAATHLARILCQNNLTTTGTTKGWIKLGKI